MAGNWMILLVPLRLRGILDLELEAYEVQTQSCATGKMTKICVAVELEGQGYGVKKKSWK